jgi:hypothetical protein
MHIVTASQAQTATQVPFWLQVVSISLAPLLGFSGVAIGAFLNERIRSRAYVNDERRKVYLEFLEMLAQVTSFYGTTFATAVRSRKDHYAEQVLGKPSGSLERLQQTYSSIRLIGSRAAVAAAGEAFVYLGLANTRGAVMIKEGYKRDEWELVIKYGLEVQKSFIEAARRDLGLPRKQTKLPGNGRQLPRDEITDIVLKTSEKILREEFSQGEGDKNVDDTTVSPEHTQTANEDAQRQDDGMNSP